ncbi:hypothetical protein OG21DRAFT_1422812, partial [Imleria badia]
VSSSTAFDKRIGIQGSFLGCRRCVICGDSIVSKSSPHHRRILEGSWTRLKAQNWIPRHKPQNGLLMCPTHQSMFHNYGFFIRFFPDICKFVFVNYGSNRHHEQFHGKAIALDTKDHHAPFPSLFLIHEMRVRGFQPFQPVNSRMPENITWQDWILSDGVYNQVTHSLNHDRPRKHLAFQPTMPRMGDTASQPSERTLVLNTDVISDIIVATHHGEYVRWWAKGRAGENRNCWMFHTTPFM